MGEGRGNAVHARKDWAGYVQHAYDHLSFRRGERILDLGCGAGAQLQELCARECQPVGIDLNLERAKSVWSKGIPVVVGRAEELPLGTGAFDGVICKVVLPLTKRRWMLGNTIYQSAPRLRWYFVQSGLEVIRRFESKTFLGFPAFVYLQLTKAHDAVINAGAAQARAAGKAQWRVLRGVTHGKF